MSAPTVFISYSHRDEVWKHRLHVHLTPLERAGRISIWDDREIDCGGLWFGEIKRAIDRAAIAVCLISPDYLASDFCHRHEIRFLLERGEREGMLLLPILLSPCLWQIVPWLERTQTLPRDGKFVTTDFVGRQDEVFASVAETIFRRLSDPNYQTAEPSRPHWPVPDQIEISRLPITGAELFGRQSELEMLDAAWMSDNTNIISLVAWGGVGKSTLVNKWLERMGRDNYRGAKRVYGWSFHSQGTSERVTSADLFISEALTWFGDTNPNVGSPWDKGERLARLMQKERTLLVLDGLEPLQSAHKSRRGKIKDPALATLLTKLTRNNVGLCIITTRERVSNLEGIGTVQRKDLEQISNEAGRALLRVGGAQGSDLELEQATRSFGNHALAINLLAVYLHGLPGHHISRVIEIPSLSITEESGKHPRRVMTALAQRFGDGPEIELLRVLGLFERPADSRSLAALRATPPISDLTDHLCDLSEVDWLRLIDKLRQVKLIAPVSPYDLTDVDAHPLVREHFAQELKQSYPTAWREGNNRLYEYLKRTSKEFPETLEEITPLYAAIAHGCEAEHFTEVLNEIYIRRILRGSQYFSWKKYGNFGTELSVLSRFFNDLGDQVAAGLNKTDSGFLWNQTGFQLMALGRLLEAVGPLRTALEVFRDESDFDSIAIAGANLSKLYLDLGELNQALRCATDCIDLVDQRCDRYNLSGLFAAQATAFHQLGEFITARNAFREAERLHKSVKPEQPFLYAFRGFRYCELLLDAGELEEVRIRAMQTIETSKSVDLPSFSIGLAHLSIGQMLLVMWQKGDRTKNKEAEDQIENAVSFLRRARQQKHVTYALLTRAGFRRTCGDFAAAQTDLDAASDIAQAGGMRRLICDLHLESARLWRDRGEREKSRAAWAQAHEMIEQMSYHRRDKDLQELT